MLAATIEAVVGRVGGVERALERLSALEVPVGAAKSFLTYTIPDTLSVAAGKPRLTNNTGQGWTLLAVQVAMDPAPTGAAAKFDVNKNGTTVFSTQANRPTVADGTNAVTSAAPDVVAVADGDYLTVDVDQVGSTTPGGNAVIAIVYRQGS